MHRCIGLRNQHPFSFLGLVISITDEPRTVQDRYVHVRHCYVVDEPPTGFLSGHLISRCRDVLLASTIWICVTFFLWRYFKRKSACSKTSYALQDLKTSIQKEVLQIDEKTHVSQFYRQTWKLQHSKWTLSWRCCFR